MLHPSFLVAAYIFVALLASLTVILAVVPMMPLFRRYAMARPNARSSHSTPTPQGGGIAVIIVTILLAGAAMLSLPVGDSDGKASFYATGLLGAALLMALGTIDDIKPLSVKVRFLVQAAIALTVVFAAPEHWRIFPIVLPATAERLIVALAIVWLINLTNFMDGIDGMVVAEIVPITACLVILASFGITSATTGFVSAALGGAVAGFYLYNKNPAKLFLGDAGSLSIGLLLACFLFDIAANNSFFAACILAMYFLFDATGTLLAGIVSGHDVTKPHRRHGYQRAVDTGWSQPKVIKAVALLNVALAVLAVIAIVSTNSVISVVALLVGASLTLWLLRQFGWRG